jgi:hypothetical protein
MPAPSDMLAEIAVRAGIVLTAIAIIWTVVAIATGRTPPMPTSRDIVRRLERIERAIDVLDAVSGEKP